MKRVNPVNKRVFKTNRISSQDYNLVTEQAAFAYSFLETEDFYFIRELLENARDYAEESILNNVINNVSEETTINENLKRIFHISKKVQVDELSGQYKLINKFFEDVQYFIDLKNDIDKQISEGSLEIDDKEI